jgi:hypothetical protein
LNDALLPAWQEEMNPVEQVTQAKFPTTHLYRERNRIFNF